MRRGCTVVVLVGLLFAVSAVAEAGNLAGLGNGVYQFSGATSRVCRDGVFFLLGESSDAIQGGGDRLFADVRVLVQNDPDTSDDDEVVFLAGVPLDERDLTAEDYDRRPIVSPVLPNSAPLELYYQRMLDAGASLVMEVGGSFGRAELTVQDCLLRDEPVPGRPGRPTVEQVPVDDWAVESENCVSIAICPPSTAVRVTFDRPAEPAHAYTAYVYRQGAPFRPVYEARSTPYVTEPGATDSLLLFDLQTLAGSGPGPYRVRVSVTNAAGESRPSGYSLPFTVE